MTLQTVPLKHVAGVEISNVDKKSREDEMPVRLCNYTDVYYSDKITSDLAFMEATASEDQVKRFQLREGDVLITKDSESADDIGIPAFVAETMPNVLCGYHLAHIRPKADQLDGRYLFWHLSSKTALARWERLATGITRYGLRHESIAHSSIRLLSLSEQRAIADFLDAETARIDRLAGRSSLGLGERPNGVLGRLEKLLAEKRVALITAAVTGQLEVLGSAAP